MSPASGWTIEIGDLLRGAAGGFLFGVPLLFTLEVWSIGSAASPGAMALALALTFVPVTLLVHTAGFRRSVEVRFSAVLSDAAEAVALGVVVVSGILVLLGEITVRTPLVDAVGKIVYEAAPFALGAAVASHVLNRSPDATEGGPRRRSSGRLGVHGTVADLGSTLIGALFVGFNIAPTEEIQRLAAGASPLQLLAVMAASVLITYIIVFQAGFGDQETRRQQQGILQHPGSETAAAYLVALVASAAMLLFFRTVQPGDPWPLTVSHVVLLGLPAAIGGAAGRLAL